MHKCGKLVAHFNAFCHCPNYWGLEWTKTIVTKAPFQRCQRNIRSFEKLISNTNLYLKIWQCFGKCRIFEKVESWNIKWYLYFYWDIMILLAYIKYMKFVHKIKMISLLPPTISAKDARSLREEKLFSVFHSSAMSFKWRMCWMVNHLQIYANQSIHDHAPLIKSTKIHDTVWSVLTTAGPTSTHTTRMNITSMPTMYGGPSMHNMICVRLICSNVLFFYYFYYCVCCKYVAYRMGILWPYNVAYASNERKMNEQYPLLNFTLNAQWAQCWMGYGKIVDVRKKIHLQCAIVMVPVWHFSMHTYYYLRIRTTKQPMLPCRPCPSATREEKKKTMYRAGNFLRNHKNEC